MIPSRFDGMMKPDYVIPFKKTKKEAVAALKEFYKGKTLLPAAFTANNRVEDIQPMYVPFWLFHCDVDFNVRFRGTRTRRYADARNNYLETSYYAVNRGGTLAFDQVPVDGSSSIADDLMQSIEPFDIREAKPFQTA